MTSDINDAAGTVIDLTNQLGAAAADVQRTTQAARTARQMAGIAARHPAQLAMLGCGLLIASGVLAVRRARLSLSSEAAPTVADR
jgi:hypothetical protein